MIQRGGHGEMAAEIWFRKNKWNMVRTQPPVTILGMVKPNMVMALKRFIPRLAAFGHMVIARLGKGGVPDYTGCYLAFYRACEVKEAKGDTMPASRLDKAQRDFMSALPVGCSWVGILWDDGTFEMFPYVSQGSYKKGLSDYPAQRL